MLEFILVVPANVKYLCWNDQASSPHSQCLHHWRGTRRSHTSAGPCAWSSTLKYHTNRQSLSDNCSFSDCRGRGAMHFSFGKSGGFCISPKSASEYRARECYTCSSSFGEACKSNNCRCCPEQYVQRIAVVHL